MSAIESKQKCPHCLCFLQEQEALRKCKKEKQKLERDLKTAQRRIFRLKNQKNNLLAKIHEKKHKKTTSPTFFTSLVAAQDKKS